MRARVLLSGGAVAITGGVIAVMVLLSGSPARRDGLRLAGSPWVSRSVAIAVGSRLAHPFVVAMDAGLPVVGSRRHAAGGDIVQLLAAGRLRTLPGKAFGDPVAYGRAGLAIAVLATPAATVRRAGRYMLSVLLVGRADGRVRRALTVTRGQRIQPRAFAVSTRGDLAVVWAECPGVHDCDHQQLRVAVRPAGSATFSEHARLGADPSLGDTVPAATLAFNARGDLVVAYVAHDGHVRARVRPSGHAFGSVRTLGWQDGSTRLDAAVSTRGAFAVAWASQDGGIETQLPLKVRAVSGSVATGRFGTRQLLDSGPSREQYGYEELLVEGGFDLDMAADGSATLAWAQLSGLYTATSERAGTFAKRRHISHDSHAIPHVTASNDATIIGWSGYGSRLRAAVRVAGARTFGPAERIPGGMVADGASPNAIAARAASRSHGSASTPAVASPCTPPRASDHRQLDGRGDPADEPGASPSPRAHAVRARRRRTSCSRERTRRCTR